MKSKKTIKFANADEHLSLEGVRSAKAFVPDWYKKAKQFIGSGRPEVRMGDSNKALKLCVPFLDSLTAGYIVELWQDIEVVKELNGEAIIHWASQPDVARARNSRMAETVPVPAGHSTTHYVWQTHYSISTPRGYSCLITHPFNRYDLPFTTLSAVVDTDINPMTEGSLPFFIRKDFEGIIPKGTPLYQILPFKRDDWEIEKDADVQQRSNKIKALSSSVTHGFYKATGWTIKKYD
jgi:hypothetical protein